MHRPKLLETKDLWQSAYLMAQGARIQDIRVKYAGRKQLFFVFTASNIYELAREFRSGRASCNIAALRASMDHLKGEIFKEIPNAKRW